MSWCHGGSTSTSVVSTGLASPVKESNNMVAGKCGHSICGFSQGSLVLHRGLRHCSNEGCMIFMLCKVCGDYTRALVNINAGCMEMLGMT